MTAWWPSVAAALARVLISRYDISSGPAVRQRPVGWTVSRHDIGLQHSAVAWPPSPWPSRVRTAHPGQAEPEATGPVAASRDGKTAQVTT